LATVKTDNITVGDLQTSIECIKRGEFAQAEEILLRIAANEPQNFDANHLLGVVCSEINKFDQAKKCFETALTIDSRLPVESRFPILYQNYGLFLIKTKTI
jgi:Flp pilus assembly protein TadD